MHSIILIGILFDLAQSLPVPAGISENRISFGLKCFCSCIPATTFWAVPSPPIQRIPLWPEAIALSTNCISSPLNEVNDKKYFIFCFSNSCLTLLINFFVLPELDVGLAIINHSVFIERGFHV